MVGQELRMRSKRKKPSICACAQPRFSARSRPSHVSPILIPILNVREASPHKKTHIDAYFSGGIVYDPYRGSWKSSLWRNDEDEDEGLKRSTPKRQDMCSVSSNWYRRGPYKKLIEKLTALIVCCKNHMYNKTKPGMYVCNPINLRCTPQECQH